MSAAGINGLGLASQLNAVARTGESSRREHGGAGNLIRSRAVGGRRLEKGREGNRVSMSRSAHVSLGRSDFGVPVAPRFRLDIDLP